MKHFLASVPFWFMGLALMFLPQVVWGASFDRENIFSDRDLTNDASMSAGMVHGFLLAKGALGGMSFRVDGSTLTAADIIAREADAFDINPQYIIARLQVEQGLVTADNPTQRQLDWASGYGRCDTCTPEQANEYKGFARQVHWAARGVRGYLDDIAETGTTVSGWGPGVTKTTLDGVEVNPENAATAAMYTYTPWVGYHGGEPSVGGNSLLFDIFTDWFHLVYPDGTLLQDINTGGIYLIRNGQKLPFASRAAFANYSTRAVIPATAVTLDAYDTGRSISFSDFSLLRSPGGTVYLYVDGTIRGITSPDVLRNLGYNPDEIQDVTWNDINNLTEGPPITAGDVFPGGALLQYLETGGVVYLDPEGFRHNIVSRDILQANFPNRPLIQKPASEIDIFSKGDDLGFPDGSLVTSNETGAVYVISNGEKRPFASGDVFNQLGYRWERIINTTQAALDIHTTGRPITLDDNESQGGF